MMTADRLTIGLETGIAIAKTTVPESGTGKHIRLLELAGH